MIKIYNIKIFLKLILAFYIITHLPYANSTENTKDNLHGYQQLDINDNTQRDIYPTLGNENLIDKNLPAVIEVNENQEDQKNKNPLAKPQVISKNIIGFSSLNKLEKKTILSLACLCVVLPVIIISATAISISLIVTKYN